MYFMFFSQELVFVEVEKAPRGEPLVITLFHFVLQMPNTQNISLGFNFPSITYDVIKLFHIYFDFLGPLN